MAKIASFWIPEFMLSDIFRQLSLLSDKKSQKQLQCQIYKTYPHLQWEHTEKLGLIILNFELLLNFL